MSANPRPGQDSLLRANTDLQHVNRALRVISACNQAMVRATDEAELLEEICRVVVRVAGYRMAWAGYAEQDEQKTIRPVASTGFERRYLESVGFSWADTEWGRGPSGRSIRTGKPAIAENIQTDSRFGPWRAEALRRGYASCISLPFKTGDIAIGVLVIYAEEAGAFTADEVRLLGEAVDDLSYGISALRARAEQARLQAALSKSEDWLRAAVEGSLDGLMILQPVYERTVLVDFKLMEVNPRAEEYLKRTRNELLGSRFSAVFRTFHKEFMRRYVPTVETGQPVEEQFPLQSPSGRTFWARHQVVPIEGGIAVTFRDITQAMEVVEQLNLSEKKYRELLENLQEGIWAADLEGRTSFANPPMAQILGYTVEEMVGRPLSDFVAERELPSFEKHRALRARGVKERYELEFRRKDGASVFLNIEAGPLFDESGRFAGTIAGVMDITARKKMELELRTSLDNLAKAEELANIGTWTYDPANHKFTVSRELRRLFGLPEGAAVISADRALRLFHPDEQVDISAALASMGKEPAPFQREHRVIRPDGEGRTLLLHGEPVLNEAGHVVTFRGFARDITESKRNQARLEYLATHDALTDLPNRRVLEDRMAQTIAHLERTSGELLAVLYLDLNRFKFVNDSFGHTFGDEMLKTVAGILQATVRDGDTVARQGGDEFIVLLRDIAQPSDVMVVAEKIEEALQKPLDIQGRELYATCSIGASLYPTDGKDMETLLKNADAAMYRAKQAGGGIHFYTRALSEQASERVQLESALRHALANDEFELHYQPQISLTDGRIIGVEALIRWNHVSEGLIQPNRFIPIAEETGLIVPIGEWVLGAACRQSKRWRDAGLPPIRIAVNVASTQFHESGIVQTLSSLTALCGVDRRNLELEITERVVMHDAEGALDRLSQLRELGVHLSVDDFGTGYSSLSYLRRLPVDKIKVDQSFVHDIDSSESARTLVQQIIDLAHAFGFTVLAEGVETARQAAFLAQHGCDECQGYYFAKPMHAHKCEQLLREGRIALPSPGSTSVSR